MSQAAFPQPVGDHPPIVLPGLWRSVWQLLRLRLATALSGLRRSSRGRKIRLALLGVLILAGISGLVWASWKLLTYLRSPDVLAQAEFSGQLTTLTATLPTLLLAGVFVGLFITSFGVLLQALYLAGDMDFLLSTPVPIRAVFVSKLLQAILPNFALTSLFALPMLFGLGYLADYNFIYFGLTLITLAGLALAAAGLSALLVMSVVRVVPARRVAEVIGFIGAISSIICSQSGQLARFNDVDSNGATNMLNTVSRLDSPLNPLAWPGRGLTALGGGQWLEGLAFTALTWMAAGGIFFVSLVVAERLFYSGWAGLQVSPRSKRKSPKNGGVKTGPPAAAAAAGLLGRASAITRLLPAAIRSIVIKDWLLLRRDLKNLSQVITPLIFGFIYAISLLRDSSDPYPTENTGVLVGQFLNNMRLYTSVGLSLFVGWMLVARLAGTGFAQEGKSFWILKTAPLSAQKLLIAKFLVAYLPALLLSLIYLVIIWVLQGAGLGALGFSLLVVILAVAGNTGLNLAFGVAGANLQWQDPRHMQRTGMGCLGSLATFLYLPISVGLFFGPAILLTYFGLPEWVGQGVGLAIGGLFCLLLTFIPPALVMKRVEQMGYET